MAIAALHGAVQNPAYRLGDTIWPARGRSLRAGLQSSEAVVLKLRLAPRVAQPRALATPVQLVSSQTSARPPAKPKALKPIDSRATLPVRMIRSAQEILRPSFCLIGPQETARLVEIRVVRPAVQWRNTLLAGAGAAAAVGDAVRARAVPRHTDEQSSIVAEVSGHHSCEFVINACRSLIMAFDMDAKTDKSAGKCPS